MGARPGREASWLPRTHVKLRKEARGGGLVGSHTPHPHKLRFLSHVATSFYGERELLSTEASKQAWAPYKVFKVVTPRKVNSKMVISIFISYQTGVENSALSVAIDFLTSMFVLYIESFSREGWELGHTGRWQTHPFLASGISKNFSIHVRPVRQCNILWPILQQIDK
jgi:hypothetical protein